MQPPKSLFLTLSAFATPDGDRFDRAVAEAVAAGALSTAQAGAVTREWRTYDEAATGARINLYFGLAEALGIINLENGQ